MPYPPQSLPSGTCCAKPDPQAFDSGFTMTFQPIYDIMTGKIFAHEALVRSVAGGGAAQVLCKVTASTRHSFDRRWRIKAIAMTAALGLNTRLSINCMPNTGTDTDYCIRSTMIAADRYGFNPKNLIFEFSETEYLCNPKRLRTIIAEYPRHGFMTAIDDFGAEFAGLGALCDMQTDLIKLDMSLVRGIDTDERRQHIFRSIVGMCHELGTGIVVEGIETRAEFNVLRAAGVVNFQGFYLGKPMFEGLRKAPLIRLPVAA